MKMTGESFELTVDPNTDTVQRVKELIAENKGGSIRNMTLSYDNKGKE